MSKQEVNKKDDKTVDLNLNPPQSSRKGQEKSLSPESGQKGFSGGELAAGAAAAGLAGGALGAIYSDEINNAAGAVKDFFTPGIESSDAAVAGEASLPASVSSSFADGDGNVYCVTLTDLNADGFSDINQGDIYFADGSVLEVVQSGDQLSTMFSSGMGYAQSSDYAQYADFSFTVNNFEGDTYLVDASDHLDASSSYAVDITNSVSETSPLEPNSVGEAYLASDSYSVQEESFMHQADASDLADSGFDSDAAEGSLDAMGEGYDGQFADTDFNALEAPDSFCVDDIDAFGLFDLF